MFSKCFNYLKDYLFSSKNVKIFIPTTGFLLISTFFYRYYRNKQLIENNKNLSKEISLKKELINKIKSSDFKNSIYINCLNNKVNKLKEKVDENNLINKLSINKLIELCDNRENLLKDIFFKKTEQIKKNKLNIETYKVKKAKDLKGNLYLNLNKKVSNNLKLNDSINRGRGFIQISKAAIMITIICFLACFEESRSLNIGMETCYKIDRLILQNYINSSELLLKTYEVGFIEDVTLGIDLKKFEVNNELTISINQNNNEINLIGENKSRFDEFKKIII